MGGGGGGGVKTKMIFKNVEAFHSDTKIMLQSSR